MSAWCATLWVDGVFQKTSSAVFEITDRGAALGDGLFETIKIRAGQPCHFSDHFTRLSASADVLHLPVPFDAPVLEHALLTLAKINDVKDGAARLVLSRGKSPRGLNLPKKPAPCMVLTIASGLPVFSAPPTLGLSSIRRNPWSVSSRHKTLSYIDNIAARLHQESALPRDEVIMLNCNGHVASASIANVFWLDTYGLHTPSLDCAILPGTMRARVLANARRLNIKITEGAYHPSALLNASAAFMTNALIGVQMLGGLDFGALGRAHFAPEHSSITPLRDALTGR